MVEFESGTVAKDRGELLALLLIVAAEQSQFVIARQFLNQAIGGGPQGAFQHDGPAMVPINGNVNCRATVAQNCLSANAGSPR